MELISCMLVIVSLTSSLVEGSSIVKTELPSPGIAPCLIPPFRNLVYQYESRALEFPQVRAGCYVQFGSEEASPSVSDKLAHIPLQFYVIDAIGKVHFLSTAGTATLQLFQLNDTTTGSEMTTKKFHFSKICFPQTCYPSSKMFNACYHREHWEMHHRGKPVVPVEDLTEIDCLLTDMLSKRWLHCKTADRGIIPISSTKFPFGLMRTMKRIPYTENDQESRIVIRFKHRSVGEGDIGSGCDVVFPLQPPFNQYRFRFWYLNHFRDTTIAEGQTGVALRSVPEDKCMDFVPTFGERACQNGSRWMEEFSFEDFCFPEECYQVQQHRCTGKAGSPVRTSKGSTVKIVENNKYMYLNIRDDSQFEY